MVFKKDVTKCLLKILLILSIIIFLSKIGYAQVSCGSTCITTSQVASETSRYNQGITGAKCLFVYNSLVYEPPTGTISNGLHKNAHACGADVTGIMKQSHLTNPNHYLTPYVCAPLCTASTTTVLTTSTSSTIPGASSTSTVPGGTTTVFTTGSSTIQPTSTVPRIGQSNTLCIPNCKEFCGQDNGCGGVCPNSDIKIPGKCGNQLCKASCAAGLCGQPDSCGGFCPNTDKTTCGLCSNPACCIDKEICDDEIDNNCNNEVDEQCGSLTYLINNFQEVINTTSRTARVNLEESGKFISKPNLLTRLAGLIAFFFAGLTLLVGIFRHQLIKRFSRKEVITYHSVLGFFAITFAVSHIFTILFDKGGWAETITLKNIFIPHFSGYVLFNVALGTIGLYLLFLTILSGILFVKISRMLGYKAWLVIHRGSFAFYLFIFFHSLRLGTDFKNPYIIVFFSQVFLIIIIYVIYRALKIKKIQDLIKSLRGKRSTTTISEILSNPDIIDKEVTISGNLNIVPMQRIVDRKWYQIYDQYTSIFASVPEGTKTGYYSRITGIVRKEGKQTYIEVKSLKE